MSSALIRGHPAEGLEHWRIEQVGQLILVGEDRAQDVSAGAQQIFGGRDDDRIDHLAPHSTLAHEAGAPEDGELLREAAWLELDGGQEFVDGVVALGEQLQHPDPRGVAQGAEELGLGLIERDRHVHHPFTCSCDQLRNYSSLAHEEGSAKWAGQR